MSLVIFSMTMSLDGFVAGLNDSPSNGLGEGGDRLFDWYFSGDVEVPISDGKMVLKVSAASAKVLNKMISNTGATIWGRKTFDIAHAWNGHPPTKPCIIVTHQAPKEWLTSDSPFIFETGGIASAIERGKLLSGDKNTVLSTTKVFQQAMNLGLVDRLSLDIVPVLLGNGVRVFESIDLKLFSLHILEVVVGSGVTHITYEVLR